MGAVQRTIEQVIADAWGNDEGGVTVHVLEEGTHLEVQRPLTEEEARSFASAIVAAADAVRADRRAGLPAPVRPPAPRGDAIDAAADRRVASVAKAPQNEADTQRGEAVCEEELAPGYRCGRLRGHEGLHGAWLG
jgi:hypothetical protein